MTTDRSAAISPPSRAGAPTRLGTPPLAGPVPEAVAQLPDGAAHLPHEGAVLRRLLAGTAVHSVYQPIVELDSGSVVAYEALVRGPRGSSLESPDRLFAAARGAGLLSELDAACQTAALRGARAAGLQDPWTLFVNLEPAANGASLLATSDTAAGGFRIVVELTERALVADPPRLLELVARIRARGWGIAVDDVGADRDSLALLPVLRPDVVKLDLRLVQDHPTGEVAEIVCAVNAEAERSGSVVLAEGIETDEHLQIALSLGATLGQGWLLGRPGRLPDASPGFAGMPVVIAADRADPGTLLSPFALGCALRPPRSARKALLIEISKHLERQAMRAGESAVILSTFQDASFFTNATRGRYSRLVERAAFVGVLAEGMPAEPLPGVRGCVLDAADPLKGEWDITVVGPHFAASLVARDLGDDGPDAERRFEFVLSHDRTLAIQVAAALLARVWPRP
jgi:EAL domain-containing protein (putative c-di-GMP-specific phosphodiesterase class I)